jgi:hypothetical protein
MDAPGGRIHYTIGTLEVVARENSLFKISRIFFIARESVVNDENV